MTTLTKSAVRIALVLALLASGIVGSTALASQRANAAGTQAAESVTTINQAANDGDTPVQDQQVAVVRKGSPAVVFTGDRAITLQLESTRAVIKALKAALAKDLARGDFHARHTQRVVDSRSCLVAQSPAGQLLAARSELDALRQSLRTDLANGDFYAPYTSRELAGHHAAAVGGGEEALARGALAVSDDTWSLEMAIERDLHAKDFRAVETHFAIDGRRWQVARF
ncbi:MAG: hypothetical protein P4L93_01610 [Coriobacteriia bacterium]|nr:hypothetical protein [Coriobacteriia bacterium]